MKSRKVSGVVAFSAIVAGTIVFMGCAKDQEVLKDRPMIPPPSNTVPSKAPAVEQPVVAPAPAPVVKPVEKTVAPDEVVPK